MLYYNHPDQVITRKDSYILIVICATIYNKEKPINDMESVYSRVAQLVNLNVERMKKAMNVTLRYCGGNYTKLDYYIMSMADCINAIESEL